MYRSIIYAGNGKRMDSILTIIHAITIIGMGALTFNGIWMVIYGVVREKLGHAVLRIVG